MKKLMKKKNNKGFSLVELIVVVLILGILAVALAPQVMKWVDRAKENSDMNNAKDIESSINIAVGDAQSEGWSVPDTGLSFELNKTDLENLLGTNQKLYLCITEILKIERNPTDKKIKNEKQIPHPQEGGDFSVNINSAYGVTVTYGTTTP